MIDARLILQRLFVVDGATIGTLTLPGESSPECFTLEDEPREVKVPGSTCIPAGTYPLKLRTIGRLYDRYRARYPWNEPGMLELGNVRGFTDILIHSGTHKGHTAGCILLGHGAFAYGILSQSIEAYNAVYRQVSRALLDDVRCYIEVRGIRVSQR